MDSARKADSTRVANSLADRDPSILRVPRQVDSQAQAGLEVVQALVNAQVLADRGPEVLADRALADSAVLAAQLRLRAKRHAHSVPVRQEAAVVVSSIRRPKKVR